MLTVILVIVFGVVSLASLTANFLLYKAAERQMNKADAYESMYQQVVLRMKDRVLQTYVKMKNLDNVDGVEGVFSKDDQVGVAFKEVLDTLQELNELTQEEEE